MSPLTQEWLNKAAEDYRTMKREYRVIEEPSYSAVCFHAQQCVEKLLKAFLHVNSIYFPKTHDIKELFTLTVPVRPEWHILIQPNAFLTAYAIDTRYPGDTPYKEEADEAVAACENVRAIILKAIKDIDQLRLE
jgi:HEPN domain-containing protein